MKAQFIKLDTIETNEDGAVVINANNISSIRRINYNDTLQTMILMVGGERFGVHQMPEEIVEMAEHAREYSVL
ncbi:MAG TPA: hypothetical protein VHB48_19945 [Chitinophagaceae bacterium]|nr:hypothetical protein [Chitinophagaceae bacterium]